MACPFVLYMRKKKLKTLFFKSLTDIEISVLKNLEITCVLLDIDNTIKPYGAEKADDDCVIWIEEAKAAGINIILCSNNYRRNVEPIARQLGCDFAAFCLKPSPFGYFRAYLKSKTKIKNILIIGDQFFTDILGGKLMFIKTFLVDPISEESEGSTVRLRRRLTKPFADRIRNRENIYCKGSKKK